MSGRIVVIGAGFAGVWSALAAKCLINVHSQTEAFKASGIKFIHGNIDDIDVQSPTVSYRSSTGTEHLTTYDRLILTAGSSVIRPEQVSGLAQHAHDVDSLEGAIKLETHLNSLGAYPPTSCNCFLDLGAWGAVITGGWERKVRATDRELAKQAKM
ncbi:uncharacterized protein CCOS01_16540 [Colletotrichum costaricense]|uniref:FAD/NAD(P)-binding domain-containing protein n=1 Tax=Colletotrichum costaricense TaxID=1209916 RepID=A0AAI9YFE1_9PEZI|nr:uncharacterized protein CCOS01_16540 [Colletotrichum costaricense]KAK1506488.1 hypothetical protein CCOS01_16540 [Colletotrichum costaricense]